MPRALSTTRSHLAWTPGEAKSCRSTPERDRLSASTRNAWRQADGAVGRLLKFDAGVAAFLRSFSRSTRCLARVAEDLRPPVARASTPQKGRGLGRWRPHPELRGSAMRSARHLLTTPYKGLPQSEQVARIAWDSRALSDRPAVFHNADASSGINCHRRRPACRP
jgi:hypothetical protein